MNGLPYPPRPETKEIVFIRHARSQANVDGIWNGRTDGPLSVEGEESLDALAKRLADWEFDVVVSSPLDRARRTAQAFADGVEIDEAFTEIDLGIWEGMHIDDVRSEHGEALSEALRTKTTRMGGSGETLHQVGDRALGAVDALFERLQPGQRAAVVTHGGFLQPVLSRHLRGRGRRAHAFSENTAITRVVHQFGSARLAAFNDTGHLGSRPRSVEEHLAEGNRVLALIRHGRTRANVEQRWQGQGDWDLDETGHAQAEALREWYGTHSTVYASPLRRAMSTAAMVANGDVTPTVGLMEINMGSWEGLTTAEIVERWPDAMETIYRHGVDLRRGETGETWGELTFRIANTLAGLETIDGGPTVVVGHGGAIRAYVSSLTHTDDSHSESLFTPPNTSVTHIALTGTGPEILDFAVSAHLETLK